MKTTIQGIRFYEEFKDNAKRKPGGLLEQRPRVLGGAGWPV
jgi:hypothetical protein